MSRTLPVPAPMHRAHRLRFLAELAERGAAAVVPTAPILHRNADSEHRFRPTSDFWYLTGLREPEAALVLLPGLPQAEDEEARAPRSVLFLRELDPEMEVWTGRRIGVERAVEVLGVDQAFPYDELWERLPGLLRGYERIAWRTGEDPESDRELLDTIGRLRRMAKRQVAPPTELLDPAPMLHELRLFKDEHELAIMRRAAEITREAHVAAMAAARPGMRENEVDALLRYVFHRRGATGCAYENIVAGGPNACVLHYVDNDDELRDGELLLIDAGAEVEFYASDVTRTFPVNGTFSPEQRAIYELVLAAQLAAIDAVRPGGTVEAVHDAAVHTLTRGLIELGLLRESFEQALEEKSFRRFYMHGTGHWLGLDVHDCGAYRERDGGPRALAAGMVTTVEPGLYVAPDDETVDARWRGIGVRIEDDVLVTADGHEVLSAGVPKTVDEVEAACRAAELAPVG